MTAKAREHKSRPLKGRPGSALWLLQHELRLYWRRGAGRPRSGLVLLAFLMVLWTTGAWFIFSRVGPAIPPPPLGHAPIHGVVLGIALVIMVFVGSVMLSQAVARTVDVIYTRNDLDLLLSSPLPPWRVLVVRAAAIAIGVLPLYAGMAGPPVIWMAIYSSPLWLAALLALIALAFFATGLALLIVTVLFRLIGPRATRTAAQVIAAVSGAAVFLTIQLPNIMARFGGDDDGGQSQNMRRFFTDLRVDPDAPWLAPARAMTGDALPLLLWVVLSAGLFLLGVFVFSRRFVSDAAAALSMGGAKKRDARVHAVRSGVFASIIRKERRLLVRDPLLLSQIGMQVVYFIPLALILVLPMRGGAQMTLEGLPAVMAILASSLAGSLIWLTVSAEDAPDLIAAAPVSAKLVDRAKFAVAVAPVLVLMSIPVIALFLHDARVGAWGAGGVLAACWTSGSIGLWRRTPGQRRSFLRRRAAGSTMAQLGQSFVAIGIAAIASLGAYNMPLLAGVVGIVVIAILVVLYRAPKERGVEIAPAQPVEAKTARPS